jgi:alpha-glucosidase
MTKYLLFACLMTLLMYACSDDSKNNWNLYSPDKQLDVNIKLAENGSLIYTLKNNERIVLGQSPLGMVFEETAFDTGLTFVSVTEKPNQKDEYTLIGGKQLKNSPVWNEMTITFSNRDGKKMDVTFRLFDTGLGFNYAFSDSKHSSYTLSDELTGFRLPVDGFGWMHATDRAPAYEGFYENKIHIGTHSPANRNWAFPMLFHTGTDWLLITDADMPEGYIGMFVNGSPEDGLYTLILPHENEAGRICPAQPTLTLPFRTPWRVIITGDNPATIVESNLVFDLSTPNVLGDVSWVKPGISSWSWWAVSDSPRDYHRLKEFVDFTAEMGWEYFLVDANWNEMKGGTLKQLTAYATTVGVGIIAWYNSGGPHNKVTEQPRDLMHLQEIRRAEFRKISEWGVKGIKVDFFESDKYCIMQQYHDILKDAADFKIMVNVHGSTIPRGWERTYPNLMTMEGVKGAEFYKFKKEFAERAPVHNTILPFSRNVIGSMDYTPVTFSNSTYSKLTTHGHELGLAVVFESALQHFADSDESYRNQPQYVIDYLKKVPSVWDETRLVAGLPGEMVVIARRNAETWYVSGISGLETGRPAEVSLSFLDSGNYTLELIADGDSANEFRFETIEVQAGQTIRVDMLPRGGFAAVINRK